MRRSQVTALAVSLGWLVMPTAAHADGPDHVHGGCSYDTVEKPTTNEYDGVIRDRSITTDGTGAPTGATVTCWIDVNGVEAPDTRFSYTGFGVQAGANQISFTAGDTDWVTLCRAVTYADGSTEPTECAGPVVIQIPPECILGCDIVGTLNRFIVYAVDPVVCPELVTLAGSYPGG
jgi:hypothetical protein